MKYDWSHTSSLMALLANCHRDASSQVYTPAMFDPTIARKPAKRAIVPITVLRDIFVRGKVSTPPAGFSPLRDRPPGSGTVAELMDKRSLTRR
jgi:hypothetical protein